MNKPMNANMNKKVNIKTPKYRGLLKLREDEKQFVVDEWHHACLTALNHHPSDDNRGNDQDYTFEEIRAIIARYGKSPGPSHPYWEELEKWEEKAK